MAESRRSGDIVWELWFYLRYGVIRLPDIILGGEWAGMRNLIFLLGGWALKYVLTGRKGFFPWMTK
jgi:hypothetical protein